MSVLSSSFAKKITYRKKCYGPLTSSRDGAKHTCTGKDTLHNFVEHTNKYRNEMNAAVQQNLTEGSFNQWIVYIYMNNTDMCKYRSLMSKLQVNYAMP